jgi:ankyrin repeat protein
MRSFGSGTSPTSTAPVSNNSPLSSLTSDASFPALSSSPTASTASPTTRARSSVNDPSLYGNVAIQQASKNGDLKTVKQLLADPRVDPSVNFNFAIRYAAENGHLDVVIELMNDKRVDPSAGMCVCVKVYFFFLYCRCVRCHVFMDLCADNNYALRKASENGHTEVVKQLVKDARVWRFSMFLWVHKTSLRFLCRLIQKHIYS